MHVTHQSVNFMQRAFKAHFKKLMLHGQTQLNTSCLSFARFICKRESYASSQLYKAF